MTDFDVQSVDRRYSSYWKVMFVIWSVCFVLNNQSEFLDILKVLNCYDSADTVGMHFYDILYLVVEFMYFAGEECYTNDLML